MSPSTPRKEDATSDPAAKDDVFDPDFLSELEGLVEESGMAVSSAVRDAALDAGFQEALDAFTYGPEGVVRLNEETFLALPASLLAERCNALIASCRQSPRREAAQAVESFVVFFQALVPTLREEASREVKATFFRLAPTLLQMAWDDYGQRPDRREDARLALKQIENLLHEVASVSLAPAESELLFRSLDQLGTLIKGGEYALARDLVAGPLVEILRKNRVARSLFRLMEVEVAIQSYLQERLGLPDATAAPARRRRRAVRVRTGPRLRRAGLRRDLSPLPPAPAPGHSHPEPHRRSPGPGLRHRAA